MLHCEISDAIWEQVPWQPSETMPQQPRISEEVVTQREAVNGEDEEEVAGR